MTTSRQVPLPRERGRFAEVLQASAELFRTHGYAGTSVQDVADVVGVNKASLYHYIAGKEDLLWEVVREVSEDFGTELAKAIDDDGRSGLDLVRAFMRRHVIYNAQNVTKAVVFERDSHYLPPERYAEVVRMRDSYEQRLHDLLEQGRADGSIRADLNTSIATKSLFGTTNWVYHWFQEDGPMTAEEIADILVDMAVRGLQSDS